MEDTWRNSEKSLDLPVHDRIVRHMRAWRHVNLWRHRPGHGESVYPCLHPLKEGKRRMDMGGTSCLPFYMVDLDGEGVGSARTINTTCSIPIHHSYLYHTTYPPLESTHNLPHYSLPKVHVCTECCRKGDGCISFCQIMIS